VTTFSVKNFEKFQHYKDRSPPWIKLYNEVLEDYAFASLPDTQKGQLMLIWLLASRMDNKIPWDAKWVASKINAKQPVDLEALARAGFICESTPEIAKGKREDWPSRYIPDVIRAQVMERDRNQCRMCEAKENLEIDHVIPISQGGTGAIENLQVLCRSCNRKKRALLSYEGGSAGVEQVATQMRSLEGETEREQNREREEKKEEAAVALADWQSLCEESGLAKVAKLTASRRSSLKARLSDCGGLDGWRSALAKIRGSPFMLGKNDRGWKIDFDFLVSESGFTKLMEGKYDGGSRVQGSKSGAATGFAALLNDPDIGRGFGPLEETGEHLGGDVEIGKSETASRRGFAAAG
jgi:hypothetical protein